MKERLTMELPLGSEIMTTVRLATGSMASLMRLDLDRSEDCKVCVTESLLLITHAGFSRARVTYYEDGGLFVRIEGEGERGAACAVPEDEISAALLGALAENVEIIREGMFSVSFAFKA